MAEFRLVNRFQNEIMHAITDSLLGIIEIIVSAYNNEIRLDDVLRDDMPDQLESIQHRHADIGDDHIRLKPFNQFQRIFPVIRLIYDLKAAGFPINQLQEPFARKHLVIHQYRPVPLHGMSPRLFKHICCHISSTDNQQTLSYSKSIVHAPHAIVNEFENNARHCGSKYPG